MNEIALDDSTARASPTTCGKRKSQLSRRGRSTSYSRGNRSHKVGNACDALVDAAFVRPRPGFGDRARPGRQQRETVS